MTSQTEQLLQKINQNLEKQNSLKKTFIKGLVNGVATLMGATIIGTLVLGLLSTIYDSIEEVPVIGDILEETPIEESINQNKL